MFVALSLRTAIAEVNATSPLCNHCKQSVSIVSIMLFFVEGQVVLCTVIGKFMECPRVKAQGEVPVRLWTLAHLCTDGL